MGWGIEVWSNEEDLWGRPRRRGTRRSARRWVAEVDCRWRRASRT
jgi:hypothetical protein